MSRILRPVAVVLLLLALAVSLNAQEDAGVLNIYSARHYGAMESIFVAFTEATGIEVRVSAGTPRDLLSRLRADIERGGRSVADVFLSIDAGVLDLAAEEGLLMAIESDTLNANIDPAFRDPDGYWYGLSIRTRTIVYNPENVTEDELAGLNDYADLAAPVWEGRVCMRPASHVYTVSLMSSLVYHLGEADAETVIGGIAQNVTRYIDSDTNIIKAVAAGECDVAFVNHYYLGYLANGNEDDKAVFNAIAIKWPNQDSTGVFFNVNGAGIIKDAANYDNALRFIEFMSELENQCGDLDCFPGSNYEFPTNLAAEPNETIAQFGDFTLDTTFPLWEYGSVQDTAIAIFERVGFGFEQN